MIYCASSLSLAVLESFVNIPPHMRQTIKLPKLYAVGIEVPDDLIADSQVIGEEQPMEKPNSQFFGDSWVNAGISLGFLVPSVVIKRELNILLNPRHPRLADVKIVVHEPFVFDDRLGN